MQQQQRQPLASPLSRSTTTTTGADNRARRKSTSCLTAILLRRPGVMISSLALVGWLCYVFNILFLSDTGGGHHHSSEFSLPSIVFDTAEASLLFLNVKTEELLKDIHQIQEQQEKKKKKKGTTTSTSSAAERKVAAQQKQQQPEVKTEELAEPIPKDSHPIPATTTTTSTPAPKLIDPAPPIDVKRTKTDTGIDVSHPELYQTVTLNSADATSKTATVMGMATGYTLNVYQRFVGSLRQTGFQGNIILGVAPDVSEEILTYLKARKVTVKKQIWVNCTYPVVDDSVDDKKAEKQHQQERNTCAHPYPDIKLRWSRFPLQRDWLLDCKECTGPVLSLDVRDTVFQANPFGGATTTTTTTTEESPVTITGLQVFQEDPSQTTQHWLTQWPIASCKGVMYNETMLCSGTTIGTRPAMLKYLTIMYEEMKVWTQDTTKKCHYFTINGDDQSIHNHLYYSGQLPFATAMVNRDKQTIVNTVGVQGSMLWKQYGKPKQTYPGITFATVDDMQGRRWILHKNITDDAGFFVQADGRTRSRVIHQFDRFGIPYRDWLYFQKWARDQEWSQHEQQKQLAQKKNLRTKTDTGIDVSDPALYESISIPTTTSSLSKTATVMGMASGYKLDVYQRFVGSLRQTGFQGNIILGVAPDVSKEILTYLKARKVTVKKQIWVNCSYPIDPEDNKKKESNKHKQERNTCAYPYHGIKIRWSRFPLQRDWLQDCKECTGPVLILDVRDSVFQADPFGPGLVRPIQGLQVFEEHPSQTTQHWLVQWPIESCKGVSYNKTMLCSGTTIGTRPAMLKYLTIMHEEMKVWMQDTTKKCRFNINGDDQSIHNHLFYSGQLPFATAMVNRDKHTIVNTVGVHGSLVLNQYGKPRNTYPGINFITVHEMKGRRWILEPNITDDEGFFVQADGVTRSRVVHQFDRFGIPYSSWLLFQDWARDPEWAREQAAAAAKAQENAVAAAAKAQEKMAATAAANAQEKAVLQAIAAERLKQQQLQQKREEKRTNDNNN